MSEQTVAGMIGLVESDMPTGELLQLDERTRQIVGKPLALCTAGDLEPVPEVAEALVNLLRSSLAWLRLLEVDIAGCSGCGIIVPEDAEGRRLPDRAYAMHFRHELCSRRPGPARSPTCSSTDAGERSPTVLSLRPHYRARTSVARGFDRVRSVSDQKLKQMDGLGQRVDDLGDVSAEVSVSLEDEASGGDVSLDSIGDRGAGRLGHGDSSSG